ncbi:MAG: hypothetical protein OXE99_08570 [Cellvibrionales bacterium]|nr:hypothetical protein [Cellvibrionales bacterium]
MKHNRTLYSIATIYLLIIAISFISNVESGVDNTPPSVKNTKSSTNTRKLSEIIETANKELPPDQQLETDNEAILNIAVMLRKIGDRFDREMREKNLPGHDQRKSSSVFPDSKRKDLSDVTAESLVCLPPEINLISAIKQYTTKFPSRRKTTSTTKTTNVKSANQFKTLPFSEGDAQHNTQKDPDQYKIRKNSSLGSDSVFESNETEASNND